MTRLTRTTETPTISVPVCLMPAFRALGWEPCFIAWCLIRHLAGDRHTVERSLLVAFVAVHHLWSPSRLRGILREGEDLFWFQRPGRITGQQLITPRGLPKLVWQLLRAGQHPVGYRVAELPIDVLRGVARRRGKMYEALVGASNPDNAVPRSRETQEVATGIPISTQRRWNRVVGTPREQSALVVGPVAPDYHLDSKYQDRSYRIAEDQQANRLLVRQIGNVTRSRFSSKTSVRLRHAVRQALLQNGESELCTAAQDTPVRYARDFSQRRKLLNKGLCPRMLAGSGQVGRTTWRLFEGGQ